MVLNNSCPFCGAEKVVLIELDKESWSIECRVCHATGPIKQSAELANLSWKNGVSRVREAERVTTKDTGGVMTKESKRLYRIGGAAFIASGILFLLQALLAMAAGDPPSNGSAIIIWLGSQRIALSFINEILFFATVLLIPAVVALYQSLAETDKVKAVVGCGIMAVIIPVLIMLLVIHGRLVYPVYGISANTPDIALLVAGMFYGGMHALNILFGIATLILSLAMRRAAFGSLVVVLGFIASVTDVVGSYPYAIGAVATLATQFIFAAWFVAVGWKLIKLHS